MTGCGVSESISEEFAGDWAVEMWGYYNAVWPDNSIVSGPTTVL